MTTSKMLRRCFRRGLRRSWRRKRRGNVIIVGSLIFLVAVVTGSLRYWQTKERDSYWTESSKGKITVKSNPILKKLSAKYGSDEEGRMVDDDIDDGDDILRHTVLGGRLLLGIVEWPLERKKKYEPGAAFSVLVRKTYLRFYDKVLPYTNLTTSIVDDPLRQQQQQQQPYTQIGRQDHPVVCSWGYFWKNYHRNNLGDGDGNISDCRIVYSFVIGSRSLSQQQSYHHHDGNSSSSPSHAVTATLRPEYMQDDAIYLPSSVNSGNRTSTIGMLERLKLDWFRSVIEKDRHQQKGEVETIFSHIAVTDSCAVIYPHLLWPHLAFNTANKYIATDPTGRYLSFSTNLLRPFVADLNKTLEQDKEMNNSGQTDLNEDSDDALPTLSDIFHSVGKGKDFREAETILFPFHHKHNSNQTTNHPSVNDTKTIHFQLLKDGFDPLWANSDPVDFEEKWETYKDDLVIYEPIDVESVPPTASSVNDNHTFLSYDDCVPNGTNHTSTSSHFRRRPKILLSIFTMDSALEAERRSTIRRTYLSYYKRRYDTGTLEQDTLCSLRSVLNNTHLWERCHLVYTFVVGGNSSAPLDVVDTFNFDQQPLVVEPFPLLEPARRDGRTAMENDDIVFLNLKENMNDGKSQSWFLYAMQLASERSMIFDYIAKMDSDTLFLPNVFMDTCFPHLPTFPNNAQFFGGSRMIVKKDGDAIDLLAPHYYQGSFYMLSWDMAQFITSMDCNRTMLDQYGEKRQFSEDKSIGNFVFSSPKPVRRLPAACNQQKTKWYYHPMKDPTKLEELWQEAISHQNKNKTVV